MRERGRDLEVPAWYKLDANEGNISLSVHKQAIPQLIEQLPRVAKGYPEKLELHKAFTPPNSQREWGFGPVLSEREDKENPDWLIYSCSLPAYKKDDGIDWESLCETSATLEVLLRNLFVTENRTDSKSPQMMEVHLFSSKKPSHSSTLNAIVRPSLAKWLNTNVNTGKGPVIAQAMKEAYFRMFEVERDLFDHNFRVMIRDPKWINITCPGDACGLDPESYNDLDLDVGYELQPHNVDGPVQQLTLLSGLAKLDNLAHTDYLQKK